MPNIKTKIWNEVSDSNCAFTTEKALCYRYDVYDDILRNASYFEYLYLIFKGLPGTKQQVFLLELMAKSVLNLGPRNASVHAAMSSAVGRAPIGAQLMSAIAVNSGAFYGAQDLQSAQICWERLSFSPDLLISDWIKAFTVSHSELDAVLWGPVRHTPGFNPHTLGSAPVLSVLRQCVEVYNSPKFVWLLKNLNELELELKASLTFTGLCALIFHEIDISSEAAQALFLILSLPGAAAHSIEQKELGFKSFPFFDLKVSNDIK